MLVDRVLSDNAASRPPVRQVYGYSREEEEMPVFWLTVSFPPQRPLKHHMPRIETLRGRDIYWLCACLSTMDSCIACLVNIYFFHP